MRALTISISRLPVMPLEEWKYPQLPRMLGSIVRRLRRANKKEEHQHNSTKQNTHHSRCGKEPRKKSVDEYSVRINMGVEEQKGSPERGIGSILSASNDGKYAIIDISPYPFIDHL